ncbi:SigB/SigF/SigG family RNA polymerase sigma factor [Actinomadura barringtoniae]|uniref:SigB/SigF/SigG family RNA polymerase sigma factor n=1 Tax=Actinomadura barringtoniae TaxID=1427535 RepID=UPI001FB5ED7B|nr:SigB/SigF/SigG family RNA polymerase sigma factor [Actinomadura barringtoniae]
MTTTPIQVARPPEEAAGSRTDKPPGSRGDGRYEDGRAEELLRELNAPGTGEGRCLEIRDELAKFYTPIVRSIARRYTQRGELLEDLQQAAYLGLVKAINNYNPDLGDHFLRYAYPTMHGEVKRHFRDKTWAIHMPRRFQELRSQLKVVTQEFIRDHRRSPTIAEVAVLLEVTEEEAVEVLVAADAYNPDSLDVPLSDEDGAITLGDTLGREDVAMQNLIDGEALAPLLDALPERERTIVLLRFFGNKTQLEIAAELGCSQMHVSRLLRRTLTQLREGLLREE